MFILMSTFFMQCKKKRDHLWLCIACHMWTRKPGWLRFAAFTIFTHAVLITQYFWTMKSSWRTWDSVQPCLPLPPWCWVKYMEAKLEKIIKNRRIERRKLILFHWWHTNLFPPLKIPSALEIKIASWDCAVLSWSWENIQSLKWWHLNIDFL